MTEHSSDDVPEHLFKHVEKSLENGIKEGMLLEIAHKNDPDIYWIASITMVCGHLLRIRFIGSTTDFWCDIIKTSVHPLGWCGHYGALIDPPKDISELHGKNIIALMSASVSKGTSIPDDSISGKGLIAIDRIKPGMKVEIQHENDPYKFWIATIINNIGGRLLVQYEAPENIYPEFWIFFTNPRLRFIGYTNMTGSPCRLKYPKNSKSHLFENNQWQICMQNAIDVSLENPSPSELFMNHSKPLFHRFEVGMKLEALNPSNMIEICPATVVKVFDHFYFYVILDNYLNESEHNNKGWLCYFSHPYIFPVKWAQENGLSITPPITWNSQKVFEWDEYLEITSSMIACSKYFENIHSDASFLGFLPGMKLEAVNPHNSLEIWPAHILNTNTHLLLIHIEQIKKSYWFDCHSSEIFPPGWCSNNNFPLVVPEHSDDTALNIESLSKKVDSVNIPLAMQSKEEWCSKICFNYKCYSGPFLSRNKLSQLPKHVGPGPLSLVIREVLNMIISVAYKPAKLLKDWEWEGKPQSHTKLEMLKAKLKTSTYHANVQVVNTNEEVPLFCKDMCSKLQACPYLFGPIEINDQCPERCLFVDKSKFQILTTSDKRGRPKGSCSKSAVPKCWNTGKKRKKKGLHFMTIRARERRAALESSSMSCKDGAESCNESDPSPSSTPQHSESGTRPNSPDSNSDPTFKKQRKKREPRTNFPPLEMKTRGAKLPNFALQIKEGHWNKKDVQTIYNNTCAVPKKQYIDSSESDSDSCNTLDLRNEEDNDIISDVSDSEEPELKKLQVASLYDPPPTNMNMFICNNDTLTLSSDMHQNTILPSNPSHWSVSDVYNYLLKINDFKEIAEKIKEEEIDGISFIMLTLPTMRYQLKLKSKPAMRLCKHVALLKWSYFSQNVSE